MKNLFFSLICFSFIFPLFVSAQATEDDIFDFTQQETSQDNEQDPADSQEIIDVFMGTQTPTAFPNLSPEDQEFMQRRPGESANDYIMRINIENRRRASGLSQGPQLPNPLISTTQAPEDDTIRPTLESSPSLTTQQPSTPRSSGNILDQIVPPSTFKSEGALNTIFNQLFWAGLVIAVILAVVMIVAGGIQYMTTDAISGKEDGKEKIRAALGGLLLAFSTVVILNTINPSITEIKLGFQPLQQVEVGVTGLTPLSLEELSITSGDRDLYQEAYDQIFVGPPNTTQGTNTNGPIPTSYFGGPADVRTKDGFALHYCNRLMQYARVGSYAESTFIGGSEYRWCYAVDSGGNKIPYTQGRASAHGGYYEPTSFSTNPNQLMRNLSGDYIAYPLNNSGALAMMGLPNRTNTQLRGKSVLLTLQNGQTLTAAVMDRGPHGSIRKLDVSPALSLKISAGGGLTSVRLIE